VPDAALPAADGAVPAAMAALSAALVPGIVCGDATVPWLAEVCTAPFAVAAARLSAARLSLVSSIVQAAARIARPAAMIRFPASSDLRISPSGC
jgi:hypothetical protein